MASLLSLPIELVAQIFHCLQDEDVCAARISNKQLEKSCFTYFAQRFFRKKGFMITTPSLRVLERISSHKELSTYVQHLWFNPDCYTFAVPACCPGHTTSESGTIDSETRSKQYAAYKAVKSDHSQLLNANKLEDVLAAAFKNLPNLETIGMRRSEDYNPCGWRKLEDTIGQDPRVLGPITSAIPTGLSGTTCLYIAIINAVARTHVRMKRLYTDAIELDDVSAINIPSQRLEAACSSLLYLEVNAVTTQLLPRALDEIGFGAGLSRLFAASPQLLELGLQIFPNRHQNHLLPPIPRDPESWRYSYPYLALANIADRVSLQHLTRIKLEKLASSSSVLLTLLKPCAARLTSLKMRDIRLLSSAEEPKPWRTLFSFLNDECPELEYILFYHLMHDRGGVSFVEDLPVVIPSEQENYLINLVPASHGGRAAFMKYDHITLEEVGTQAIRKKLSRVIDQHWYHKPLFSYAIDEELWHTDTSDEE